MEGATPGNTVVSEPIQLVDGSLTKTFQPYFTYGWVGLVSSRFTQTFSSVSLSSTPSGSGEVWLMPFLGIPNPYVPGDTYGFQILTTNTEIPLITDGSVHTYTLPSQTNGFFVMVRNPSSMEPTVTFTGFSSSGVTPVPESPTYLMLIVGLLLVGGRRLSGIGRNAFHGRHWTKNGKGINDTCAINPRLLNTA